MSNPKDPLLKSGAAEERELFKRFTEAAHGFSMGAVIGASANMIVNCLRQAHVTRAKAEGRFDELFGRLKTLLLSHYDGLGRRMNIFPRHQVIHAPLIRGDDHPD